ncbi:MAG: hypothetical protein CME24_12290 [Gemmatimonadetes bacterium]|jgi:hypothetical protein|nr:hypothetical protein [Gemmatimonadota bacterium]MDP6983039.1 phytanoyl-CoA dioxygenase family protein [Candidatus Latescibacterota bacterium]MEE3041173.1 phytanoyl-CoA dioxygenase family protein [Candidatus Latescibacterota bacterium]MEE3264384.1 phytanoyl-CoA dioxygenase family protein [Candidatus Latescibacterota bacterium]
MIEPLLFNKDLGRPLQLGDPLPRTNADGLPIVPLTQEQKYVFDTRGWLLVPGVLSADQIEPMRDFIYQLDRDRESLPEKQRTIFGFPLHPLMDHPVVVGFMNEFLCTPYLASEECYGFRMEMSFPGLRSTQDEKPFEFHPHNGSGMFRMPGDGHMYHCLPGKAHSGLTRVVWELNDVEEGDGGTMFISGSHKAAFTAPESAYTPGSPLWDTYSCPAGSVLFFTEAVSHSGVPWANADQDRVALFNAYNDVNSRWSMSRPSPELLEDMPPLRQSLFREAYTKGNVTGKERGAHY